MQIKDIYEKYRIMPQLQEHMYRVAAVGSIIADNTTTNVDRNSIVTACLLHDMGNIIKFELDLFPKFLEPKGLVYWESVKKEFVERYGSDEHKATQMIAREIGVNENVLTIIDAYGFSKGSETKDSTSLELKIATYSDMRVAPYGVEDMTTRVNDMLARKKENMGDKYDIHFYENLKSEWMKIENNVFESCRITPSEITDEIIKPVIESLKEFEITY